MCHGNYKIRDMDIKTLLRITCCLLFVLFANPIVAEQEESGLITLKVYLQNFDSFSAKFEQKVLNQSGEVLETSSGIVSLQKPGKFFWTYQDPYSQLLVSNGKTLWIYDEDLEQVTINDINADFQNSPALLLSGDVEIEEKYQVLELGEIDGYFWIELVSKDDETEFNSMRLGFEGSELMGMILFDNLGQITQLLFQEVTKNTTFNDAIFEFIPPDGVDIIDSRE